MNKNGGDYRIIVLNIETNNSIAVSSPMSLNGRSLSEVGDDLLRDLCTSHSLTFYTNNGKLFLLSKEALVRVYFNFELCEEK
jgi:hypothetical protein